MTDTEARNELEAKILDAQEGRITSDDLLKILMGSQVFMPVQDEKAPVLNIQRSARGPSAGAVGRGWHAHSGAVFQPGARQAFP